jgi:hypothetical protein
VRGFQSRDNSFQTRQFNKRIHGFPIGRRHILRPAAVFIEACSARLR